MKIKKKIKLLSEIQKKHCRYCFTTENLTLDHKVPISMGGTDDIKNIQVLCRQCNQNKSSFSQKQIRYLFKWFVKIQESRQEKGRKPWA